MSQNEQCFTVMFFQEELRRRDEEGEAMKLAEAEMKVKVSQLTRRLEERQREVRMITKLFKHPPKI